MFAALNQLEIAPAIVNGLFYALLIAIVGSVVVAFGGGGIPVAREYLSRWGVRARMPRAISAPTPTPRRAANKRGRLATDAGVAEQPPPPPPTTSGREI